MQSAWLDRATPLQYQFWANALIRREHMELTEFEEDRDFNGRVLRAANIDPLGAVLDIGCGYGEDLIDLADPNGLNHQGLLMGIEIPSTDPTVSFDAKFSDLQDEMTRIDKRHLLIIKEGYAQSIPAPSSSVQTILAANVLQHVPIKQHDRALEEIERVLVPGGTLIVITNAAGNKMRFHSALHDMASYLGSSASGPISANFDLEKAKEEIPRHGFCDILTYEVNARLKITPNRVDMVIKAADTYKSLFNPPVTYEQWSEARRLKLEEPMWQEIQASPDGAYYDELHRGAVVARKIG